MRNLWGHRPITDFWQISGGIANRLAKYGIFDMRGIVNAPEMVLYKEFGVNAEYTPGTVKISVENITLNQSGVII